MTDTQQLMEYVGTLHTEQMAAIAKLGQEFSAHKGAMEVEVQNLKDERDKQNTRQWIHTGIIVPILASIHAIANHFGVKI